MASIITGFEYDIFISYRQKDNKGDRWVSQFVQALKTELEATFKEDVSIYFDEDPHDGLLETHQVDKSLEVKMKSLVFIPVISQTYCDIKSFAWQHEFCAFNKLASGDQFGRDVKLSSGNVASRILPVKINDLEEGDRKTIENEIGGVLRAIDFIYLSPGVNRPLRATEDNPQDNLNKTFYRDQINKVARAIKERIVALQHFNDSPGVLPTPDLRINTPARRTATWVAGLIVLLGILAFAYYYFYGNGNSSSFSTDNSIAVLPFVNMSNDPEQEYFSDGLTEEVLNVLTKAPGLKVIARTSSFSFKGKSDDVRTIAKKLGVAHVLEGSVRKSGDKIRVTAQLIKADDGAHIWSETYERSVDDIFQIQDDIAGAIFSSLKMSLLVDGPGPGMNNNAEVNNLLLKGNYFYERRDKESLKAALGIYESALVIDSMDARVWAALAKSYISIGNLEGVANNEASRKAVHKALELDNALPEAHRVLGFLKSLDYDYRGAVSEYDKVLELQPANSDVMRNLSSLMKVMGQFEKSIGYAKRSIELDPIKAVNYWNLATANLFAGDYEQVVAVIKTLADLQPNYPGIHKVLAETYLLQGKTDLAMSEANELEGGDKDLFQALIYHAEGKQKESTEALERLVSKNKGGSWAGLAQVYAFTGMKEDAFKCIDLAYDNNSDLLSTMKVDPLFINLRSDPRFNAMLLKMKIPID